MGLYLIAETHWLLKLDTWIAFAMVGAGLGFVIFVHELGHFLAAKWCGVKCEKFYIGFDIPMPKIGKFQLPSSLFKFQWGETEYGIGVLPLGGYVKMLGQDDDPRRFQEEADRVKVKTAAGAETTVERADQVQLDPRSYPAKTVPQRMLIISAGVIMNLIFAVIFGAVAYFNGVPYTPCEVGGAAPGTPAWMAGLRYGDRIVQLGKNGKIDEQLRFDWDLAQAVNMNGNKKDFEILVRRPGQSTPIPMTLRPRVTDKGVNERFMIGAIMPIALKLSPLGKENQLLRDVQCLSGNKAAFEPDDLIVAVNGQTISEYVQLTEVMWKQIDQPLMVTVERTKPNANGKEVEKNNVDVIVEPNRMRRFGFAMKTGAISAVGPDSPAEKAGIKDGDVLLAIDGQPFQDVYEAIDQLRVLAGNEIEVEVQRSSTTGKADETLKLRLTPNIPRISIGAHISGGNCGLEAIGVVVPVANVVAMVPPDSPAFGIIQPGDRITKVQRVLGEKSKQLLEQKKLQEGIEIDEHTTWLQIESDVQDRFTDMSLKITVDRNGKSETVELVPVAGKLFYQDRDLPLTRKSEIRIASSLSEAFALGVRQTKEDAMRVATMLQKLVSRQISLTKLGGPGTIAVVAANEAMGGWGRLLIFLTFLSANLAVMNFMPVPALDGGHMVFLTWEAIFRRPPNERIQGALTMAGVCCLLCLMVFVVGLDIWRFSQ